MYYYSKPTLTIWAKKLDLLIQYVTKCKIKYYFRFSYIVTFFSVICFLFIDVSHNVAYLNFC